MKKIKDTLNLPKTGFSMKANLAQKEPEMIKYWEEIKLYDLLQSKNKDGPNFLLHDGPPYACLLYTSPSPRDSRVSRMPSSA